MPGADDLEHGYLACEGAPSPAHLALSNEHDEACSCQSIDLNLQRSLTFADGTEALCDFPSRRMGSFKSERLAGLGVLSG